MAFSCAHSRPDVVRRLQRLAEKWGKSLTRVDAKGAMDVYLLSHAPFARWLRSWYKDVGKCPPGWVERLGPEHQQALLRGYMDADGYVTHKDARLTSVGLEGLLAARRMLARQGIAATIRRGARGGEAVILGRACQTLDKYDLRFHQGREALGYAPAVLSRAPRDFIEDGWLWSKVRRLERVGKREFAPIKTPTSSYVTHFGLSHNCDDLEDDRTVYTAARRAKTRSWWKGTVLPMLSRGGTICVIGTRKHHDDLYAHLKKDPLWRTIEDPAVIKWPDHHEVETEMDPETLELRVKDVKVHGESKVLWPEERSIEYLISTKVEIGDLMFGREFQHKVQDDSSAAVKMEYLDLARSGGPTCAWGKSLPASSCTSSRAGTSPWWTTRSGQRTPTATSPWASLWART